MELDLENKFAVNQRQQILACAAVAASQKYPAPNLWQQGNAESMSSISA
jgi:post-segregation antitoxin (ccd killing protein)